LIMPKIKKTLLGLMIAIFCAVTLGGTLFFIRPAKAQVSIVSSVPDTLNRVLDQIIETLKVSVVNSAVEAVSYFAHKIAYDTAVYLASGGQGQKPLLFTDNWGEYLGNTAAEAGAKAVEGIFKAQGLNLCQIPDIKLDLALRVNLQTKFGNAQTLAPPECTFQEMKFFDADAWNTKYGDGSTIDPSKMFNASLSHVEESDLGIVLDANSKIGALIAKSETAAALDREVGRGVRAVENTISGKILTPQSVIESELGSTAPSKKQETSMNRAGDALSSGMYQILPSVLSTFVNTLLNQGLNNLIKGMFPEDTSSGSGSSSATNPAATGPTGGRRFAEQAYSYFLIPKNTTVDKYNILGDFASCPSGAYGLNNCVMDNLFVKAVQEADFGKPLTIQDAVDKGWLNGGYKLIPPSNSVLNNDKDCYQSAYCYSNIQKLRRAGILPLGFEIAALNSPPDNPWTLLTLIKNFDECSKTDKTYDSVNYPYCHLIDPNWVLKVEQTRCEAKGYTETLLSSVGGQRLSECVDMTTCVKYDSQGSCLSYGYCLRNENIWKIDGDACSAQYSTCLSFKNTKTSAVANYLRRTLDYSYCNSNAVGCKAYSLDRDMSVTSTVKWKASSSESQNDDTNSVIYFNSNLSSSCSSNSAGCSALALAGSSTLKYYKKAPAYLGCYDTQPTLAGVQWPKSRADLINIKVNSECSNYAGVCVPEEENCNWYTELLPATSNKTATKIPGRYKPAVISNSVVTWNDQCDSTCAGYDAYREMPSLYSAGTDVAYIIPPALGDTSSGKNCAISDNGCTSFTNVSANTASQETVEYFTDLRVCISPDQTKQKTFSTYEGSEQGGYQLKVYILEKDANGGPKQFYKTLDEQSVINACASGATYKIDLECRQFNDDQGKIYYRLLNRTIPVDSACTPYRMTKTEMYTESGLTTKSACEAQGGSWEGAGGLETCRLCFSGGSYRSSSCYYYGLPSGKVNAAGASRTCSSAVDSCRQFKGNGANNIRAIVSADFENTSSTQALSNWSNAYISNESTYVGGHSLGYTATAQTGYVSLNLNTTSTLLAPGNYYNLSFYAKADSSKYIHISLTGQSTSTIFGQAGVDDNWKYFSFGPVQVSGINSNFTLNFVFSSSVANSKLFLDNIELTEINDSRYLVKNKLTVPAVCDTNQLDELPGEALGCKAYKNPAGLNIFLTGFEYLCRENAIGCTAFTDTYNTLSQSKDSWYNVWLSAPSGSKASLTSEIYCQVPVGETGCYVNIAGYNQHEIVSMAAKISGLSVKFVSSTIHIPADTATTSPIYLVADANASCSSADTGCSYAGAQTLTPIGPTYTTVLVKNDPALYDGAKPILCQSEAVGCSEYSSGNSTYYFKDPAIIGQKVCSYSKDTKINGVSYSGWFWKDVGVCATTTLSSASSNQVTVSSPKTICTADTDCKNSDKCLEKNKQPCYPNYLQNGNNYGLWSYGTTGKYENFVGECSSAESGCTEYMDHNDNNKSYYVLNNTKISTAISQCSSQVSLNEGCVLFDQRDNPSKLWHTSSTYKYSEDQKFNLVTPLKATTGLSNDANVIMKVIRDRECSEWLQCKSSQRVYDSNANAYKEVCYQIGRCDAASDTGQEGGLKNCTNWVDGEHYYADKVLSPKVYVDRDVSWKGNDFTGYSILGMYPLEELTQVNLAVGTGDDWTLAKPVACGTGKGCKAGYPNSPTCNAVLSSVCGEDSLGQCVNGVCVKSPYGGQLVSASNPYFTHACRTYPEADSPYPATPAMANSTNYGSVNLCSEGVASTNSNSQAYACDCSYTKATYGSGSVFKKYFDLNNPNSTAFSNSVAGQVPSGICSGGTYNGVKACTKATETTDCGTGATCLPLESKTSLIGWKGFCLQADKSRTLYSEKSVNACLMWYPVQTLYGADDIYSTPEAGYSPTSYGQYYCLQAAGFAVSTNKTYNKYQIDTGSLKYIKNVYERPIWNTLTGYINSSAGFNAFVPRTLDGYLTWVNNGVSKLYDVYDGNKDDAINEQKFSKAVLERDFNSGKTVTVSDSYGSYSIDKTIATYNGGADPYSIYKWLIFEDDEVLKRIHLNDIDYVSVRIDRMDTYMDIEESAIPGTDYDYQRNINEIFVIRNNYKDNITKPVITKYGQWPNDLTVSSGCQVVYADGTKAEDCLAQEKRLKTKQTLAQSEIINADNYVAMRFIVDAQAEDKTGTRIDVFSSDHYGFIKDAGDKVFDCKLNYTQYGNSWPDELEVVVLFDKTTGLFQDIQTAFCSSGKGEDDSVVFNIKISFNMKETCAAIAEVGGSKTYSATWTDRLWSYSQKLKFSYDYSTEAKPYGSLGISSVKLPVWIYSQRQDYSYGVPYSALGWPGAFSLVALTENPGQALSLDLKVWDVKTDFSKSPTLISQLFAKASKVFLLSQSAKAPYGSYKVNEGYQTTLTYDKGQYDTKTGVFNFTETADFNIGKPFEHVPKVYSLVCDNTGSNCHEGAEGITVNGISSGSVLVPSSPAAASVQFFAVADPNHMPITALRVNWDDGNIINLEGSYRNRRGVTDGICKYTNSKASVETCHVTSTQYHSGIEAEDVEGTYETLVDTKVKCTSNAKDQCKNIKQCVAETSAVNYGQIVNKTCDNDYYQFNHVYQCYAGSDKYLSAGNSACPSGFNNGCCIYEPKVQVLDNWGWCNGLCLDNDPSTVFFTLDQSAGGAGCYDGQWKLDVKNCDKTKNNCLNECTSVGKGVSPSVSNQSPWTPTSTKIIVAPSSK